MEGIEKERQRQGEIRRKQRVDEKEAAEKQQRDLQRQRQKEKSTSEAAIKKAEILSSYISKRDGAIVTMPALPAIRIRSSIANDDVARSRAAALEKLAQKQAMKENSISSPPPPPPISQRSLSLRSYSTKSPRPVAQSSSASSKPAMRFDTPKAVSRKEDKSLGNFDSLSTETSIVDESRSLRDSSQGNDDKKPTAIVMPNKTPLQEGWSEHIDQDSGKVYYYNNCTNLSTWDHPESSSNSSSSCGLQLNQDIILPEGWMLTWDPVTKFPYYYNRITQETCWDRPKEATIGNSASADELVQKLEEKLQALEALHLPEDWMLTWDPESKSPYYYNRITQETCWDRPKEATIGNSASADELVQKLEEKLQALEALHLSVTSSTSVILDPLYTISKDELDKKEKVKSHPGLTSYQTIIEQAFNEAFIAAAMIRSGEFQLESGSPTSGSETEIMDAINVMSIISANLPIVAK